MIEINNLSFSYQNSPTVLENLNLKVNEGETIAIVGPNGSGKTTLGCCLCGLIPHIIKGKMDGEVIINRKNTREHNLEDIIKNIGYIFQDPDSQFVTLRVKDELTFGLENIDLDDNEIKKRVNEISNLFCLSDIMDRAPQEISMGQKQKVILASIVAMKPNILVLDEPSSNFDPKLQKEFIDIIKKFQTEKFTIIIFSHNFNQIRKIANRVIVLNNKKFQFDFAPEFLCSEKITNIFRVEKDNIKKPVLSHESSTILSFENVSFKYPRNEKSIIEKLSFTIKQGEIFGIAGPNGSGKSTLLLLMSNLLKPNKGKVTINGIDINKINYYEFVKLLGIVFQNPNHQIFASTILEELVFGLTNLGIPQNEIHNRIKKVSDIINDMGDLNRDPHALSYGQRKLLCIATVLLMDSKIILFDEPELALDIGFLSKIKNLILRLNMEGKTIVVISHDLELLEDLTHNILFLDDGKIKFEGKSDLIINKIKEFFND